MPRHSTFRAGLERRFQPRHSSGMAYWAVARTLLRKEAFAAERLAEAGFRTFLPRVETARSSMPLFANYVFVQIVDVWHVINRTLGIVRLIKFGDLPAVCPDSEVAALQARTDESGLIRLPAAPRRPRRAIQAGTKVRIVGGAFAGLRGIHSGMSSQEREFVLIAMLGAVRQIPIPSHQVEVVPL
jgi:transcriptional antiterminator RfaH